MASSWFPVRKGEEGGWKLDVVSLLAVIGESAMDSHIQVLTSSWYCILPRILPAPQALLKPSRFTRLPQINAAVVGVHNGTLVSTLNYFPEILHPIEDLPAFTFKVLKISHRDEKVKNIRESGPSTQDSLPRVSSDPIMLENGLSPSQRQPTLRSPKRIMTKSDERPRISARKCSPLSMVTILSFLWTCGLIIWAGKIHDGVAILALITISMVSSVVGIASWWQPVLMSRPSKAKVPPGDVVIRTREGAFLLVQCNEDVARELYTGTEECQYYVNTRVYRVLVGFGTFLLMISVVLLGNCGFVMQAAIGLSYMVLNGIFWAASLIDRTKFWNLSIYQVEDVTPDDCKDAHLWQTNDSKDLELKPSFTRTMWYAIRETKKIGWVERGGAAPKTCEWDDKVDIGHCKKKGIRVTNTPDVLTDDVADLAIGLMLATLRGICECDRYVRGGLWKKGDFKLTRKFSGKKVGIIGLGRIGTAIAKRAEAFNCPISYYSRSQKPESNYKYFPSVVELASDCEILVVACPLTEETRHIINRQVLDALGPKGFLINIGRGPHVDEPELVSALVERRIAGAGLDVYENEPHVPEELFNLDNVVLVPHIGSGTLETRIVMADLVLGNLEAHFSNKPLLTPVV